MPSHSEPLWPDEVTGLPPDTVPFKRPRGRPPGSKNKTCGDASKEGPSVNAQTILIALLLTMLKALDFTKCGTADRVLLLFHRDTSPSEMEHEDEFREGGNGIAPVLATDRLAANLVDVVLCHGAEDFKVIACDHAKSFRMPESVEYGSATRAEPWLRGIVAVVKAYQEHLSGLGLGVSGIFVVFASDYLFGDNFVPALEEFRAFQEADPRVVVIPAMFGNYVEAVAEKVSVRVKPVDLKQLRITDFIRIVAESVRQVSSQRPGAKEAVLERLNTLNTRKD